MDVQAEKKECRSDLGSCDKQLIYPRFMQLNSKQPNSNCWGRWGTIRRKENIENFNFRVLLDLRAMFSQKFARFLSRDSWRQAYTWWMEKAEGTWKIISVTSSLFVCSQFYHKGWCSANARHETIGDFTLPSHSFFGHIYSPVLFPSLVQW